MSPTPQLDLPDTRRRAAPLDLVEQLELFETDIRLPNENRNYRPAEAAEYLAMSVDQVHSLRECGALEAFAINDDLENCERLHWRFTGRGLAAFINRRRKLAL